MLKYVEKPAERAPMLARPQQKLDRKAVRALINERFSETLDYLAK